MFYLTTHSTHFIYGYMASDIWLRTILIVNNSLCPSFLPAVSEDSVGKSVDLDPIQQWSLLLDHIHLGMLRLGLSYGHGWDL